MRKLALRFIKMFKKELSLNDWSIDIEFNRKIETAVYFNRYKKEALITINNKDIPELKKWIYHEMLHIKYPDCTEEEIKEKEGE